MAVAGGEPKNEAPFTRAITARALTQQLAQAHPSVHVAIRGESKNQAPFTRR